MRKIRRFVIVGLAALSTASPALAQQSGHVMITSEQHRQMIAQKDLSAAKATQASGVVKAIDRAKGTVTIAHGAIAALKWPAMTMSFRASKVVLVGVKAGQRVNFSFASEGSDYRIIKISRR